MRISIVMALIATICTVSCGRNEDAPVADAGSAGNTAAVAGPGAVPLGRLGDEAVPIAYRLDLVIDPNESSFRGATEIDIDVARPLTGIWLHGRDLAVDRVYAEIGGTQLDGSYEQVDVTGVAQVRFDRTLPAGRTTLHFDYSAPFASVPDGLYHTDEGGDEYAATQLESISARKVFPGFDEPRFKTPFDIAVTAQTVHTVVTSTPEIGSEDLGNGMTRHVFQTTEPLPTYLLAFAVGPYDVNEWQDIPPNDIRAKPLPLRGIAVRGRAQRMDYALAHTATIVQLLESYFAVPHAYPKLDIIAPPDFFGGAMENAGAIMYTEYLMLMDESSALQQRRAYTEVHAHELAHQWFGNYVTPAWWDDIWLNEAFATWMASKIARQAWPEGAFERDILVGGLGAMADDSLASARQIREPVATNASIDDAFDGITYQKGGAVLTMFETYLGEQGFREGVRTHMRRFAFGTATVDDFAKSLADGSGRPEVIPAFRSFIDQPGVPLITAKLECDDRPALELEQQRYAPTGSTIDPRQTWQIPLCVAIGDAHGDRTVCALMDAPAMSLPLDTGSCPDYVVPNGNGSGYFRFALDESGWAALAHNAGRLDANQALAYADSLDAAFRAGSASADTYLNGVEALARHEAWDALTKTMDVYEEMISDMQDEGTRRELQTVGRQLFRPLRDMPAANDDTGAVLLRSNLSRFLALVVLDDSTRAELLDQARRYIGIGGEPDRNAVDAEMLETALSVGVQEDGAAFFDALLQFVASTGDPAMRAYGLGALARTEEPALTARLLDTVAADGYSAPELFRTLYRQIARPGSRDAAWAWARENFDSIVNASSGIFGVRAAVGLGASFCSPERAAEYEALIRDNADRLTGFERALAQSMEQIELCMSLNESQGDDMAKAAAARL